MENKMNENANAGSKPDTNRKPFQTPTLRVLGKIDLVVEANGNNGGDNTGGS